jgi:hypothetical protein
MTSWYIHISRLRFYQTEQTKCRTNQQPTDFHNLSLAPENEYRKRPKDPEEITIPFCEYANWHEMAEFLIQRLRSENPNLIIDPRLFEKLQQQ